VRLERAGEVCPELHAAYRTGRLSWVKAHALLPLLRLDIEGAWRPAWVRWAQRVTVRRLEADVARALLLRAGHDRAWQRAKVHPERAQDPLPEGERPVCAPGVDPDATHQRCLHPGLLRVRGRAPDRLAFEVARRPGGAPLARYRSGDVVHGRHGARTEGGVHRAA